MNDYQYVRRYVTQIVVPQDFEPIATENLAKLLPIISERFVMDFSLVRSFKPMEDQYEYEIGVRLNESPTYSTFNFTVAGQILETIWTTADERSVIEIKAKYCFMSHFDDLPHRKMSALFSGFQEFLRWINDESTMGEFSPNPPIPSLINGRHEWLNKFKDKLSVTVTCPCVHNPEIRKSLEDMVIHLNDNHKWKRERIADWMDELHAKGVVNLDLESPNQDRA